MQISIGADHRGFEHKDFIIKNLNVDEIRWNDVGCFTQERCDYPEFAYLVVQSVLVEKADLGILLCGSGIGMVIAANRFKGIYAGLVWNEEVARLARRDDNVNVLVLPANFISLEKSLVIIAAWLKTEFLGKQYQKRLEMIDCFSAK